MARHPRHPLRILLLPLLLGILLYILLMPVSFHENSYDEQILSAARKNKIPASLIKAVIRRESCFDKDARGRAGEIGLMQLMPGAVKDWARETGSKAPHSFQLYDPALNITIGSWYLARCRKHYAGYLSQDALALAEYNAGYSRVKKWKPADPLTPLDIAKDVTIESTQKYINTILAYQEDYLEMDLQP